jgi:Phage integrase, N-terminal SAM-like domain
MDQVREILRYHYYAIRTEQANVSWILQFIRFNGKHHPTQMGKPEIDRFLSPLAINRNIAPGLCCFFRLTECFSA